MAVQQVSHPSVEERVELGRQARQRAPRSSHEGWVPAPDRPDPVALLETQNLRREPDLVPVRHGRMLVSPFSFFRGAATVMAADLASTPRAGLASQLCGDAHLSNFGLFASPERNLVFDLNDFDETLPGPFEYDVKRLAASFTIAARNNGFSEAHTRSATLSAVASYRKAMLEFAGMGTLDIWYAHLSGDELFARLTAAAKDARTRKVSRTRAKALRRRALTRDSLQALSKLGERVDGRHRIVSQPPLVVPLREFGGTYKLAQEDVEDTLHRQFRAYRATLQADRRHLLESFEIVDIARKVVGVGSVGTRAFIALLQGRDERDPHFLQVKEATASVLEDHLPRSRYAQPGARVVQGQRLMQASSDIFLGWTKGVDTTRYFYWRQLRDMKVSVDVEALRPAGMTFYAQTCGWTLARAHARSGDPVAMAAYLGTGNAFDRAIADFAERYADQNERDYAAFAEAVRAGRLEAVEGV
jgi:uncharacterized protein (DUF2252 family)